MQDYKGDFKMENIKLTNLDLKAKYTDWKTKLDRLKQLGV